MFFLKIKPTGSSYIRTSVFLPVIRLPRSTAIKRRVMIFVYVLDDEAPDFDCLALSIVSVRSTTSASSVLRVVCDARQPASTIARLKTMGIDDVVFVPLPDGARSLVSLSPALLLFHTFQSTTSIPKVDSCCFLDPFSMAIKDLSSIVEDLDHMDDAMGHQYGHVSEKGAIIDVLGATPSDQLPFLVRSPIETLHRLSTSAQITIRFFEANVLSSTGSLDITRTFHRCLTAADASQLLLKSQSAALESRASTWNLEDRRFLRKGPTRYYYPILLQSRPDRVRHVAEMRRVLSPGATRIVDAVDGKRDLDASAIAGLVAAGFLVPPFDDAFVPGRSITINNVAAFLSHRRAVERFLQDAGDDENAVGIVLEDDVILLPSDRDIDRSRLDCMVDRILDAFDLGQSSQSSQSSHPDVVQLYIMPQQGPMIRPPTFGVSNTSRVSLIRSPVGTWGMQCYMMRPAGARKLLRGLWPMRGAVDEQLTRLILGTDGPFSLYCLIGEQVLLEDDVGAPSATQENPTLVADVFRG